MDITGAQFEVKSKFADLPTMYICTSSLPYLTHISADFLLLERKSLFFLSETALQATKWFRLRWGAGFPPGGSGPPHSAPKGGYPPLVTYYIICIRMVTLVFHNAHELHSCYNYHILRARIYFLWKFHMSRYQLKNSELCNKVDFCRYASLSWKRPYDYHS